MSLALKKVSPLLFSLEREDPMNYSCNDNDYVSPVPIQYKEIKVGDVLYQCTTSVLGIVLKKKQDEVTINLYIVDPYVTKVITLGPRDFNKNYLSSNSYIWVKAIKKNSISTKEMTIGGRKRFTRKSGTKQSRNRRKSRLYKIPARANILSFRARMYETI